MKTAVQPARAWSESAFLSYGFRPFFLSAALWAALCMGLWILMLRGYPVLPTAFDPVSWHAHEALFGYLSAVISGFLLTAVPTWTNRAPISGWPLLGLWVLWILGRVAIAASQYLPALMVAAIDLSSLLVLVTIMLREIVVSKNWRNLVIIAMVGVFVIGNALFHREAALGEYAASGYGLRIGLAAAILMISIVGGRIVPAFTRNWMLQRGSDRLPAVFGRLDRYALILSALALVCWVVMPGRAETAYLLFACGLMQFARLSRWRGLGTGAEPLVWILHLGYAFVPIGMLMLATAILRPGSLLTATAQHLWMAGAIGVMTLAVMTRTSLGHTGRRLTADKATTGLYLLVIAAVLARLLGGALPEHALPLWTLSACFWCCGFAGFALLYGRYLVVPRND